jgi:hypothetical protein
MVYFMPPRYNCQRRAPVWLVYCRDIRSAAENCEAQRLERGLAQVPSVTVCDADGRLVAFQRMTARLLKLIGRHLEKR